MRINVYSQELTSEVLPVSKVSNTGIEYKAVQFVLHSSPMLHHPPKDDDRSAVTFWLPQSVRGLLDFKNALYRAGELVDFELNHAQLRAQPHKRASTQHVSGSIEYHNKCVCGAAWPCAYAHSANPKHGKLPVNQEVKP